MVTPKQFGENLQRVCSERGVSVKELASVLDTTEEKVLKVFEGEMFISPFDRVEKMCTYLNTTVQELLGGSYEMKVLVLSRSAATLWAHNIQDRIPTAVISITDPRAPLADLGDIYNPCPVNGICGTLRVQFMDTDAPSPDCIADAQAEDIARFVHTYKHFVERFVVHCEAGQSRSAGVAAAILKYYTGDDSAIYDNPKYTPNSTCYRRVLNALQEVDNPCSKETWSV